MRSSSLCLQSTRIKGALHCGGLNSCHSANCYMHVTQKESRSAPSFAYTASLIHQLVEKKNQLKRNSKVFSESPPEKNRFLQLSYQVQDSGNCGTQMCEDGKEVEPAHKGPPCRGGTF